MRRGSPARATIARPIPEDRFGARVLEVGFADIRLLVSRPPQTLKAAQRIAAEHFAFCDGACIGLSYVSEIAPRW